MTAKDSLKALVDGLSEEEAERELAAFRAAGRAALAQSGPVLRPGADREALIAFLREPRAATMTEEEWEELARSIDEHRYSPRKLFS